MADRLGKSFVTGPELQETLSQYGLFAHKQDVYLFVRRYDKDADGRLQFTDFCDAFMPLERELAHDLKLREGFHSRSGFCKQSYF
jgi:Ca2+-binding EF-hand superfamily protein